MKLRGTVIRSRHPQLGSTTRRCRAFGSSAILLEDAESVRAAENLAMNCTGALSAGNPQATCDVAGAGNGATAIPKRARRGKPRIQAKEEPTGHRASARPYRALRALHALLNWTRKPTEDVIEAHQSTALGGSD